MYLLSIFDCMLMKNSGMKKSKYSVIKDCYESAEEVTAELVKAGLESSNLIIGIDFTKSNEWTGEKSFNGQSLHHISNTPNQYEKAISIIGQTLAQFDEDNLIPCFGFGDVSTRDRNVFSFYPDHRPCNGFTETLTRYRELAPNLHLSGPTSFAPIIEMAMSIVENSGGQYHVLLIIADGQVTTSEEQLTIEAIVKASEYPLSIVLVGVGDGPWGMMKKFDDNIPARSFDNFQFVNFTDIMMKKIPQPRKEAEFALAALMEIPSQYKATLELGILGRQTGRCPRIKPLPPPVSQFSSSNSNLFQQNVSKSAGASSSWSRPTGLDDQHVCPICLVNRKDIAFGCGHQTCEDCSKSLQNCPICRTLVTTKIKLY